MNFTTTKRLKSGKQGQHSWCIDFVLLCTLLRNQNMRRLRTDEEAESELECRCKSHLRYYKPRKNPTVGGSCVGTSRVCVSKLPCRSNHLHPNQSPRHLLDSASMRGDWSGARKVRQRPPIFLRSLESSIPSPL